jgi:hypothetical protein
MPVIFAAFPMKRAELLVPVEEDKFFLVRGAILAGSQPRLFSKPERRRQSHLLNLFIFVLLGRSKRPGTPRIAALKIGASARSPLKGPSSARP